MSELNTSDNDKLQEKLDQLVTAISVQEADEVRRLLEAQPALVHAWEPDDGDTALSLATHWNTIEEAQLLLDFGADPNQKDQNGKTSLHLAAQSHHLEMMLLHLQGGANVNVQDYRGRTPLHVANYDAAWPRKATSATILLLRHGADPNIPDEEGNSPLHLVRGNVRSAVCLIGSGANVEAYNHQGRTPLHMASHWSSKIVGLLIRRKANVNVTDALGLSPLHHAVMGLLRDCAECLLCHGADPHARDRQQRTPLHIAALKHSGEGIQVLLAAGADVNARDSANRTALAYIECDIFEIDDPDYVPGSAAYRIRRMEIYDLLKNADGQL